MRITTSTNGFCATAKTSTFDKDVAARVESEEVADGLHSDDRAAEGFVFGNRLLLVPFRVEKALRDSPAQRLRPESGQKVTIFSSDENINQILNGVGFYSVFNICNADPATTDDADQIIACAADQSPWQRPFTMPT